MKKKITMVLGLVLCSLSLIACDKNDNEAVESMQKHEVSLSLENYETYIEIRSIFTDSSGIYYFDGTLDYAYYDNCVVTYSYKPYSGDATTKQSKLSAGGYGSYFSSVGRYTSSATITGVSGTVIYWL